MLCGAGAGSRADPLLLRCRAVLGSSNVNSASGKERAVEGAGATLDALDELVALFRANRADESAAAATGEAAQDVDEQGSLTEAGTIRDDDDGPVDVHQLRKGIERSLLDAHRSTARVYIDSLDGLVQSLDSLESELDSMASQLADSQKSLGLARTASKNLLGQAEGLQQQLSTSQLELALATLFIDRFSLSESQLAVLSSKELNVGPQLFEVLERLEKIRSEARVLLEGSISPGGPSLPARSPAVRKESASKGGAGIRAGMHVMDATSRQLNAAYAKMGRWLTFEFRQPVHDGMEVSPVVKETVRRMHLANRDDILKPALVALSETRASYLSTSFQMALTVGQAEGSSMSRPIELHAHDPLRYAGDMLAWVHQALASEREYLTALFSGAEDEGGRRIGQRRRGLEGSLDFQRDHDARNTLETLQEEAKEGTLTLSTSERATREMLDRNMEGCCRPLRTRVTQTIRSQEGSITAFKLANLIDFYRITMTRTLGSRAMLSRTLADLKQEALNSFTMLLQKQSASIERWNETPAADLTELPPPIVSAAYTLKELLTALRASFTGDVDDSTDQQTREDGERHLALLIERLHAPMLAMAERLAKHFVDKRPRSKTEEQARWEQCVFLCNCYEYIAEVLRRFSFATAAAGEVSAKADAQLARLGELHYEALATKSGLAAARAAAVDPLDASKDAALAQALTTFSAFLPDALIAPPSLGSLLSHSMRAEAHRAALRHLADTYDEIATKVRAADSAPKAAALLRPPEEVRVLLAVA